MKSSTRQIALVDWQRWARHLQFLLIQNWSMKIFQAAFDDAIAELDTLSEESYKDSTLIMQVHFYTFSNVHISDHFNVTYCQFVAYYWEERKSLEKVKSAQTFWPGLISGCPFDFSFYTIILDNDNDNTSQQYWLKYWLPLWRSCCETTWPSGHRTCRERERRNLLKVVPASILIFKREKQNLPRSEQKNDY